MAQSCLSTIVQNAASAARNADIRSKTVEVAPCALLATIVNFHLVHYLELRECHPFRPFVTQEYEAKTKVARRSRGGGS